MGKYNFPCGCSFDIVGPPPFPKSNLPALKFDIEELNEDCRMTWKLLKKGNTVGVFQLEGFSGEMWSKSLKPETVEHIAALTAILRPGCTQAKDEHGISMTEHFCRRKNRQEDVDSLHPSLDPILSDTYGIIVYQEQALKIAQKIAGFNLVEIDKLRKAIGKKLPALMAEVKEMFLKGAERVGLVSKAKAEEIFDIIEKSQRYSFNKCIDPKTVVETKSGYKHIDELIKGEYITSPNGWVKVVEKYDNGPKQLFDILLASGHHLRCTLDHKFETGPINPQILPLWEILNRGLSIRVCNHSSRAFNYGSHSEIVCDYSQVSKLSSYGLSRAVDIEVDHPSHLYYAQGISTSNSHGVSYGKVAFITAYLKAHFPIQFFTSYLFYAKDKQKPLDEIRKVVNDAKLFNIYVGNPCLIDMRKDFYTDGQDIYFGLCDIKGVGEAAFKKLTALPINKNLPWLDFLFKINPHISSATTNALIISGAMDYIGLSRTQMLFEFEKVSELTDGEMEWFKNNYQKYPSLTETFKYSAERKKDGGAAHTEASKNKLHSLFETLVNPPFSLDDRPEWLAGKEEEFLGVAISASKLDGCDTSQINCTCKDFNDGKGGNHLVFGVTLNNIKTVKIKNGKSIGADMAFAEISDNSCGLKDVTIFPETLAANKDLLFVGNTILLTGYKDKKRGSLVVQSVHQI